MGQTEGPSCAHTDPVADKSKTDTIYFSLWWKYMVNEEWKMHVFKMFNSSEI